MHEYVQELGFFLYIDSYSFPLSIYLSSSLRFVRTWIVLLFIHVYWQVEFLSVLSPLSFENVKEKVRRACTNARIGAGMCLQIYAGIGILFLIW